MCRDVVWLDWMSLGVPEIWIMLNFQQRLRESSVWLVHPDQNCSLRQRSGSELEVRTLFRAGKLNPAARENTLHLQRVFARFNQISEQLAGTSWTHRVLSDCIEPSQPFFTIRSRMVQQQERRGSHVLRDVA